jgi:arsenical pump membrane protein
MLLPSLIFITTLIFVIWQPRGLQIGTTAVIGAVLSIAVGVVSFADVLTVTAIVWDATLVFIGIILISMVLDELGFFEWAAIKMARLSRGSGHRMFIYSVLLGAIVSAFFANDGAALILTPIILAKMRLLELNLKSLIAFVMAGGFIADSASNPFIFSNLTNIVTVNYFDIGFWAYTAVMILPNFVAIGASVLVLWLFFRKEIPSVVDTHKLKHPREAIRNQTLFKISWFVLAGLLAAYTFGDHYGIPISIFALAGAALLLALGAHYKTCKPLMTIKAAPWQVVWFSIGLYVVVWGLKNAGLTGHLAGVLVWLGQYGETAQVVGTGIVAAILSAVMNNMPTVMVMDIAIDQMGHTALAYANIIGCNLGPKLTPWGSLATLIWLHVLARKGVRITYGQYMKVGFIITPPVLIVTLLAVAWFNA